MFRNQRHPSPVVVEFRERVRSRRPRPPHLAFGLAHYYVGVSRQAVSARIRAGKLHLAESGYGRRSRWNKVSIRDLDAWIQAREAHLAPKPRRPKPGRRPRTAPKQRGSKTRKRRGN